MATVTRIMLYVAITFVAVAAVGVYSMKVGDRRLDPLRKVFASGEAIHGVTPDTSVCDCVRKMTTEAIGALVVVEGTRLLGIFTERDALQRVLAEGRDPANTRVAEVMTKDPCCVGPDATVGDAMELVTRRRFRHLPVVDKGRLLAVVSSGDLTHWLVQDRRSNVLATDTAAAGVDRAVVS